MESIKIEYKVSVSDFRKASYYGVFLRYKKPLLVMFIVVIGAAIYLAAGIAGLGKINYLVLFIAAAYLIWGLIIFSGVERNIKKYLNNPDNMLNCTYYAVFDKKQIRISVPEKAVDIFMSVSKLACVFELSAMFLIYPNTRETYIVPMDSLTDNQRKELREHFRKILGNRFGSRF